MASSRWVSEALFEAFFSQEDRSQVAVAARFERVGRGPRVARLASKALCAKHKQLAGGDLSALRPWLNRYVAKRGLADEIPCVRQWLALSPSHRLRWPTPEIESVDGLIAFMAKQCAFEDLTRERVMGLAYPRRSRVRASHRDDPYERYWIAKRSGGARLIEAPRSTLRAMQRALLDGLIEHIPVHRAACGFRTGQSVVDHASRHVGRDVVIRIDLEDFFHSFDVARVRAFFELAGYARSVSYVMAALCTTQTPTRVLRQPVRAGGLSSVEARTLISARQRDRLLMRHMPQGAPSSPALSNALSYSLDTRLAGLAERFGASYSRYADDLVFSGDSSLARHARELVVWVSEIVRDERFEVRASKTQVMTRATRQVVGGLVVNERVGLPRREREALEALVFNCVQHGPASQNRANVSDFRAHLAGRVAYATHVDPVRAQPIAELFSRIVW
ncbi:MAG: reverse transcriptase family protein [Polyangiaceae bacterium]